jgi:hypothetical protein
MIGVEMVRLELHKSFGRTRCGITFDIVVDAVQQRLDANPQAMRQRRETVEHPVRHDEGAHGRHALMKTLPKVAAEMALSVLAII